MSLLVRPYDDAMSTDLLEQVRERRQNPDGVERRVKMIRTNQGTSYQYPWDELLLGDYFVVPLGHNHVSGMRTRFKQVALRRDFEITVTQWDIVKRGQRTPALRVALTYNGSVKALKEKAGVPVTDGRWTETRRERRKGKRE